MSTQPASDRALRGALSLPGVNAGASRAILVIPPLRGELSARVATVMVLAGFSVLVFGVLSLVGWL